MTNTTVPRGKQDRITVREYVISFLGFSEVLVAQLLVFYVVFCVICCLSDFFFNQALSVYFELVSLNDLMCPSPFFILA